VSLTMLALVALFPIGLLVLLLLTSGLEGRVVGPGSDLVEAALTGLDDPDQEWPAAGGPAASAQRRPVTSRKTSS
jgi:hypothetical protein